MRRISVCTVPQANRCSLLRRQLSAILAQDLWPGSARDLDQASRQSVPRILWSLHLSGTRKKKRCCCSWWCIRAVPPSTALFFLVPHLFLSSSLPLSLSSSLPLCLSWKPIVPSSLPLIRSSSLHLFLCSCLPLFLSSSVSSFLSSALPLFLYSSVPLFLPSSQEAATNTHTCRDAVDGRASLRSHHQLHCCFALPPVGSCGRCLFSQCPSTPRHAQSPLTPRHAPNPNTPRHAQCPIKPRHTQCMHGCQS